MENIINIVRNWLITAQGVFSGFGILDALDVIFVAVILYLIVVQIRRTQSLQIMKGVLIVILCYLGVNLLDLRVSQSIFRISMSNLLLIVVILFNNEFRSFISRVGQVKFSNLRMFGNFANREQEMVNTINATVRACESMSEDRIGSLIVFQRKAHLGDLEHTGVPIDAITTTEMLLSIFFPNSALHDGAIIIRDGKIVAARCVVPLKTDREVSEKVGTRHRAAMEATRGCDAIAVVTSEETGIISIAENGELFRGITDAELREKLMLYLLEEDAEKPIATKFRKIFKGGKKNG
jgi:diadenylate cyclase